MMCMYRNSSSSGKEGSQTPDAVPPDKIFKEREEGLVVIFKRTKTTCLSTFKIIVFDTTAHTLSSQPTLLFETMSMDETNPHDLDLEDESPEQEHDQLPTVEEAQLAVGRGGTSSRRTLMIILSGLAGFLLLMAITIPVARKNGRHKYSSTGMTSSPKNITEMVYGFALNGESDFQDTSNYQFRAMIQLVEDPTIVNYEEDALKQRYAMYCLHHATTPNSWVESSGWKRRGVPECDWYGVTCQEGTNIVTRIELRNNGLQGEVPEEMLLMTPTFHLLNVNANDLVGTIPPAFCQLASHHGWEVKVDCAAVTCACCTNCE